LVSSSAETAEHRGHAVEFILSHWSRADRWTPLRLLAFS
jgi:hypothetical protein